MACLAGTLRSSGTLGVEQNSPKFTPLTAKLRVGGRHRQIALRHQLAARRRGHALHAGNDRHRQLLDAQHHAAALGKQRW
jgi:hypothetical protein